MNYKQILKAVNRGIKFALDDFEDNEIQGQVNSKVSHQGGTKEWLDLMKEVVDLGLPSGTLWCKYNLDVDPNKLSKAKNWYGKYYAWGETETSKPCISNLTKYKNEENLTELLPEDDAAYSNMHIGNYKFHIPTKEQCEELIDYTNGHWEKNYQNIEGLNGWLVKGKNGNELFLPAAGYYSYRFGEFFNVGFFGDYITSTLYLEDNYYLRTRNEVYTLECGGITSDGDSIQLKHNRYDNGYYIRPVINL